MTETEINNGHYAIKVAIVRINNNACIAKGVIEGLAPGSYLHHQASELHRQAIEELVDLLAKRPGAIAALYELEEEKRKRR